GLFVGALLTGPLIDRRGRRPVYASNMFLLALVSALQYFAANFAMLLALRVGIGLLLGSDYVVSKAMLNEFTPRAMRGRVMSLLSIAWAGGYSCAYFAGLLVRKGIESWRFMLLLSVIPCLIAAMSRLWVPESPPWLACRGRVVEAEGILRARFGPG